MNFPDFHALTIPDWATTDAAKAFFMGFVFASFVVVFRVARRWFSRGLDPDNINE